MLQVSTSQTAIRHLKYTTLNPINKKNIYIFKICDISQIAQMVAYQYLIRYTTTG